MEMNANMKKMLGLNAIGSVEAAFEQFNPKIAINEGDNKYLIKTIPSPTQKPYYGKSVDITIPLTDSNVDVVEFNKSFFTLNLDITLDFDPGFPLLPGDVATSPQWMKDFYADLNANSWPQEPGFIESAKRTYIFVGFKNATDAISTYRITHNNLDIGESQTATAQLESFLYNVMKPKCDKENKRNTHTLWEDAHKHNASVCGKYFSHWELWEIFQNTPRKLRVQFPITIGFDDILPFQGFTYFPSAVFGDLALVIRVSPDALVWCSVDPKHTIVDEFDTRENLLYNHWGISVANPVYDIQGVGMHIRQVDQQWYYDKRFTQLNTSGHAATNVIYRTGFAQQDSEVAMYAGEDITVRADNIITWEANSTICGFALESGYKEVLRKRYEKQPFVVPGEVVRIFNFSTAPSANGLNCVLTIPMLNVKEVCVLFPRRATDLSTFYNPCLSGLQINMVNRQWPDQATDTTSPEFFRLQLEATNLDGILSCTESFESSYVCPPTYKYPIRDRSKSDNTDFVWVLPTERSSGNAFFFDGIYSRNETISLRGNLLNLRNDDGTSAVVDTYYILNRNDNVPNGTTIPYQYNTAAPIIALVSDSFFIFQTGKNAHYETSLTWNEVFAQRFPDIYKKLVDAYNSGRNAV
jgi:hypothetical protein